MIFQTRLCYRIAFSAIAVAATTFASSAQRLQVPLIDIDCSAYGRQNDGTWAVLHSNKVVLGSNVNKDVMPGDDPRNVQLTPHSTLDGVLNVTCAKFKK